MLISPQPITVVVHQIKYFASEAEIVEKFSCGALCEVNTYIGSSNFCKKSSKESSFFYVLEFFG